MHAAEIVIVGAGIVGLSVASELARRAETVAPRSRARVTVLEMESQPAYHSSGRSAAAYIEPYVGPLVMHLTQMSHAFFSAPPEGFSDVPLIRTRGGLTIARTDQHAQLDAFIQTWRHGCPQLEEISVDRACSYVPVLRRVELSRALFDPKTLDLDVHALISGHRRELLRGGGQLLTGQRVVEIERAARWRIRTQQREEIAADLLVIAAGAWSEELGMLAGGEPIGLVPKRRTACLIDPPATQEVAKWPIVHAIDNSFYVRPESGRLMVSPADATPSPPCDAAPEEIDVATAIDRLQEALDIPVRAVAHRWAGLRSFVEDQLPVAGFDDHVPGLFWLCAQGGAGVQTSPALAAYSANLLLGMALGDEFGARGIAPETFSPRRLRRRAVAI